MSFLHFFCSILEIHSSSIRNFFCKIVAYSWSFSPTFKKHFYVRNGENRPFLSKCIMYSMHTATTLQFLQFFPFQEMTNLFLLNDDVNVIVIDWGGGASGLYR